MRVRGDVWQIPITIAIGPFEKDSSDYQFASYVLIPCLGSRRLADTDPKVLTDTKAWLAKGMNHFKFVIFPRKWHEVHRRVHARLTRNGRMPHGHRRYDMRRLKYRCSTATPYKVTGSFLSQVVSLHILCYIWKF